MSTRANIIIESKEFAIPKKLYFYRHSDGYPEGVKPTLDLFVSWLKKDIIRNNIPQSSGWLILLGTMEYDTIPKYATDQGYLKDTDTIESPKDWKCGAYEPTTGLHGDIEHLYVIDLDKKEWREEHNWDKYR